MGFFGFGKKTSDSGKGINWTRLTSIDEMTELIETTSKEKVEAFFKHSTRCSISSMALSRLEGKWDADSLQGVEPVYLDLIANRDLSNALATKLDVWHESPQLLIVKDGKCVFNSSHNQISVADIKEFL